MTPTVEQTFERIRQVRTRFKLSLQPPADDAAIDRVQGECQSRFGLSIPTRYVHLLRIADGVEDNGARFYGSMRRTFTEHPDRGIPGILDETATWWHRWKQLMLGNIEDQLFCYDHSTDEYHVWNVSGNEPYRRFKEFDELFAYAFDESRLYIPDLPPPPDWSRFAEGEDQKTGQV